METNLNNVSERVVLAQPLLQGMQQITESALTNNQQINQHHSYWISLMWNGKYNISLSRQEVAFWEECRKIRVCGSLRKDFYTRFKPKN